MRIRLIGAVALLATALSVARAAEPRRVDISAEDVPLAQIARELARQAEVPVRVDEAVAGQRLSLQLQGVPLPLALHILAEVTGLQVGESGGGYLIRRPAGGGGEFRPLQDPLQTRPALDRNTLSKVRVECEQTRPSRIAGYFGGPAVQRQDGALVMRPAVAPTPQLRSIAMPMPANVLQPARVAALQKTVADRFTARWSGPASLANQVGYGLPMPAGMLAIIGYDPSKTLVAVGEPAAAEQFAAFAKALDLANVGVQIQLSVVQVPVGYLAMAPFDWRDVRVAGGETHALARTAIVSAEVLAEAQAAVFDQPQTRLPALDLSNGEPLVAAISRTFAQRGSVDDCIDLPANLAEQVDLVMSTCDVKLIPLVSGVGDARRVNLLVTPVHGDVVVDVAGQAGPSHAAIDAGVPRSSTLSELRPGEALLYAGVMPEGPFRAPGACKLMARLPIVGDLFRPAAVAAEEYTLVLAVVPQVIALAD